MNLKEMLEEADPGTRETLSAIERVLVADRCTVKDALISAYRLGKIDGLLAMTGPKETAQ